MHHSGEVNKGTITLTLVYVGAFRLIRDFGSAQYVLVAQFLQKNVQHSRWVIKIIWRLT
jgi:hypothetical protein